jgi:hypothetical protein
MVLKALSTLQHLLERCGITSNDFFAPQLPNKDPKQSNKFLFLDYVSVLYGYSVNMRPPLIVIIAGTVKTELNGPVLAATAMCMMMTGS